MANEFQCYYCEVLFDVFSKKCLSCGKNSIMSREAKEAKDKYIKESMMPAAPKKPFEYTQKDYDASFRMLKDTKSATIPYEVWQSQWLVLALKYKMQEELGTEVKIKKKMWVIQ